MSDENQVYEEDGGERAPAAELAAKRQLAGQAA